MRGEYYGCAVHDPHHGELPPHARRIHEGCGRLHNNTGTTSACAENTSASLSGAPPTWNYLRMRGEYLIVVAAIIALVELPPHARRIPLAICGGNGISRNYLRMRGEYASPRNPRPQISELPPHARRIPVKSIAHSFLFGTTSACAENTQHLPHDLRFSRNYLRMRGEYSTLTKSAKVTWELPPHARRIQNVCKR